MIWIWDLHYISYSLGFWVYV